VASPLSTRFCPTAENQALQFCQVFHRLDLRSGTWGRSPRFAHLDSNRSTPARFKLDIKCSVRQHDPANRNLQLADMAVHPYSELSIGFTYDQKSAYLAQGYSPDECSVLDADETIEMLASALSRLGHVDRIGNIQSLVKRLAEGARWDVVFNICEGLSGSAREAQVPGLLEAYRINHVFSDALVYALCMNKAKTKARPFIVAVRLLC
jgi:hypothetical protein